MTPPEHAYRDAPSIADEIRAIAEAYTRLLHGSPLPRTYWLRKAALLDRISLREESMFARDVAAPAVRAAEAVAAHLIAYERQRGMCSIDAGPPLRTSDSGCEPGHRAYVRREYLAWRLAQSL